MRKPYQSPGQDEKLILLYCPGRGLNSRPPAHRSFKHGQVKVSHALNHSATEAVAIRKDRNAHGIGVAVAFRDDITAE